MITDALAQLVTQLQTIPGNINASWDVQTLELPGILATLDDVTVEVLDNRPHRVTVALYLIAPDHGSILALRALDRLLARCTEVLGAGSYESLSISLPNHNSAPLPALRRTIEIDVTA